MSEKDKLHVAASRERLEKEERESLDAFLSEEQKGSEQGNKGGTTYRPSLMPDEAYKDYYEKESMSCKSKRAFWLACFVILLLYGTIVGVVWYLK